MPVPVALKDPKDKHSVFLYCNSLKGQANDLSGLLNELEHWDVNDRGDVAKAERHGAPVVWLVGHGLSDKAAMLDKHGSEVVTMGVIIQWCIDNGAKHVIDTACFPKARKAAVIKAKAKFSYYCKNTDQEAKSLGDYQKTHPPTMKALDSWWDGEGQHKAHP